MSLALETMEEVQVYSKITEFMCEGVMYKKWTKFMTKRWR